MRPYHHREVPTRDMNIRPHLSTILVSIEILETQLCHELLNTYRSYADDVLKEMTRPNTVPNTVNNAFEIFSECGVNLVTSVTTVKVVSSAILAMLYKIRTGCNQGEEQGLRPNVIDDRRVEFLHGPSPGEQWILSNHGGEKSRCLRKSV